MPTNITKPTVGGSSGTWGTELNTALDTLVSSLNTQETNIGTKLGATSFTAKGDLLTATAASTATRLGVGTDGQTLTSDSSTGTGLAWKLAPGTLMARLIATAGQSLANDTVTAITWNQIVFDRLGVMSAGTANYTPNLTGYYEFTGGVSFLANATGIRMCYWNIAGSQYSGGATTSVAVSGGYQTSLVARPIVAQISSGQSVSLFGLQTSTAALSTSASNGHMSYMNVKWLGAS